MLKLLKLIILITFLISSVNILKEGFFFKIKNIYIVSEKDFDHRLLKELKDNYFTINTAKISFDLLKLNPDIEDIKVSKIFPNSLSLSIRHREPLAVATESRIEITESRESTESAKINLNFQKKEEPQFLIDKNGVLFEKIFEEKLPVLGTDLQNKKVGDRIEDNTALIMLQILQQLKDLNLSLLWIANSNSKVVFQMEEGELVITSSTRDITRQVSSLQLIRNRFRIEGKKLEYIDLRFEKPVVKLSL